MSGQPLALITGGLGGIGEAVRATLVDRGYQVVVADRDAAQSSGVPIDLAEPSSIDQALGAVAREHGRLDALVNCVGIKVRSTLAEAGWDEAAAQMTVNTIGAWYVSSRALPLMARSDRGRIVHISSIAAEARSPLSGLYAASKAALNTLVSEMASEWGSGRLTVNAVAPALVETAMSRPVFEDAERLAAKVARIPAGRSIEAHEVARAVAFLCEAESGAISGQVLRVDGGAIAAVEV